MVVLAKLHLEIDELCASSCDTYSYLACLIILSDHELSIELLRNSRVVSAELCSHLSTLSTEYQGNGVHSELALVCAVYAEDSLIVVVCKCRVLDVACRNCDYRNREWLEWFRQYRSDAFRLCQVSYIGTFLSAHVADLRE